MNLAQAILKVNVDPIVRDFARLVMMAQEQAQQGRIDLAFVLCCTALESLLVGSDQKISRTLSMRLGAIKSLSYDSDFKKVSKDIDALYKIRSRFTHSAKPVDKDSLDRLFDLCQCAYVPAVLASVANSAKPGEEWIPHWHKILDYLAAALAAGVQLDSSAVTLAGISPTTETSTNM